MKKITFLTIAIMLSVGASMAQDFTVAGIGYKYGGLNGGVLAWGAPAFKGALVIPATVSDGTTTYNVTELRHDFMDKVGAAGITSITVPEGVVNFEANPLIGATFYNTVGSGSGDLITAISLPSTLTLTNFPSSAFFAFPILTSFTIKMATPPTVVDGTFYNFNAATITVHIPTGKTAAYQTAGWTTAILGSGVHTINLVEDVTTVLNNASALVIHISSFERNVVVSGLDGMANVSIFDLSGKGVAKFTNVSNNQVLSNPDLKDGIYVVKVINGTNNTCSKLIIN